MMTALEFLLPAAFLQEAQPASRPTTMVLFAVCLYRHCYWSATLLAL